MKSKTVGAGSGVFISLFLIFILGVVHPLGAGSKGGAALKIATKDGTIVKGELLGVKGRALLVDGGNYDKSSAIELDDIRDLAIVGESNALLGAGIGLLAGGLVGAVWHVDERSWFPGIDVAVHAGAGAGIGFILGGISGYFVRDDDERLIVATVYQLEPGRLLKKLRAVSKDPEYR